MSQLKLSRGFGEKMKGRFEKYEFEVGVIQDGPHKLPAERQAGAQNFSSNLGSYAGGPVRKKSRTAGPLTIAEVSAANRARLGINYLTEPFQRESSDIVKFFKSFLKLITGRTQIKRVENLLQAVVRNPILRGEYGRQARSTTREKGFYRPMIDTAQLFKSIKAVARRV